MSSRGRAATPTGDEAAADNLKGAIFMMASMAGFVANDTLVKSLAGELPLPQVIFIRGVFASALLCALVLHQRAFQFRPDRRTQWLIALRVCCEIGATLCFLNALFNMPLANATAILMVAPLAVTLAAALLLGEPVGWRRYTAILIGFLGVLVIVRPGAAGFNLFALSALGAVAFIVGRDLLTRHFQASVPSAAVAFATAFAIMLTGAILTPAAGWQPVPGYGFVVLAAAACCLVVGYLFGVMTMRVGDVGFVSPFRYTVLLWALLLGALVFDEFPDVPTLLGSLVVVGTGLYTLHRENVAARSWRMRPHQ